MAKNALHLDGDLHYEEETLLKRRSGKRVRHKRNNREDDVLRLRSRKIIRKSLKLAIPKPKTLFKWFITLKVDVVLLERNFMQITTIVNSSHYLQMQCPQYRETTLFQLCNSCMHWDSTENDGFLQENHSEGLNKVCHSSSILRFRVVSARDYNLLVSTVSH